MYYKVLPYSNALPRFMEKTGRSGTAFHKSNAIMLLVTFFSVRLVYGARTVSLKLPHLLHVIITIFLVI